MDLLKFEFKDLLNTLDGYQKNNITLLLENNTLEQTFEIWLKANGPENTASFGGSGHNDFSTYIKNELIKFFTDDPSYQSERNELKKQGNVTSFFAVSFISSALSSHIGIVSSVIAPIIVLVLGIIGKIGINAFINYLKTLK